MKELNKFRGPFPKFEKREKPSSLLSPFKTRETQNTLITLSIKIIFKTPTQPFHTFGEEEQLTVAGWILTASLAISHSSRIPHSSAE
jgi:hypothetical protein